MLINKIILSNFKNFESVEVNLGKMSVIVGANAAGKSNFIQALSFVQDIKNYGIENAISLRGGIEYLRNLNQKENKPIRIEIHFEPIWGSSGFSFPIGDGVSVISNRKYIYTIEIVLKKQNKYEIIKEDIVLNTRVQAVNFAKIKKTDEIFGKDVPLLGIFTFIISSKKGKVTIIEPIKKSLIVTVEDGTKMDIGKDFITPFMIPSIYNLNEKAGNKHLYQQKTIIELFPHLFEEELFNFSIYDFDLKKAKQSSPITGKVELAENGENLAIVLKNILEDKEKTRQFSNFLSDILPYIKQMGVDKFYDKSLLFKVKESYQHAGNIPSFLLSDGTIAITAMVVALFFEHRSNDQS